MILMILILATLFYVMLIVSSFFLILIENKGKYFWTTTLLCLFGLVVSYLFLNNFYDTTYFTEAEIISRYDYKFINIMQYIYFYMCIIMNFIYLIKGLITLKKKKIKKKSKEVTYL